MTEDEKRTPPAEPERDKIGRRKPTGRPKGSKTSSKRLTIRKVNKILGLHLSGAPHKDICQITDSSSTSVTAILNSFQDAFKHIKDLGPYRNVRNDLLDATELLALKSLNDGEKIAAASWRDLAQGFEKIAKINRLYQGKSTENTAQTVTYFDRTKPEDSDI